jgi:hypothetical protein
MLTDSEASAVEPSGGVIRQSIAPPRKNTAYDRELKAVSISMRLAKAFIGWDATRRSGSWK